MSNNRTILIKHHYPISNVGAICFSHLYLHIPHYPLWDMDVIKCGSGAHDIECVVGRGTSGQSGGGIMRNDEVLNV